MPCPDCAYLAKVIEKLEEEKKWLAVKLAWMEADNLRLRADLDAQSARK